MPISEITKSQSSSNALSFTRASRVQNFIDEDDFIMSDVRLNVETLLTDEPEDHIRKSEFRFCLEYADHGYVKNGFLFKSIKTTDGTTEITYKLEKGSEWQMKDVNDIIENFAESEQDQMSSELQKKFKEALSVKGITRGQSKEFLLITGQNYENVYLFMVHRSATNPEEDRIEFFGCDNKEIKRVDIPNRKLNLEKKDSASTISTEAGSTIMEFEEQGENIKDVIIGKDKLPVIQKNTSKSSRDFFFSAVEGLTNFFKTFKRFSFFNIFKNRDHNK